MVIVIVGRTTLNIFSLRPGLEDCKAFFNILERLYSDTPSSDKIWPSCSHHNSAVGRMRIILFNF